MRSLLAIALTLFLASLWLYSRNIDFPYYYHADEPGKAAQIIKGMRNFHHPLLMVDTVALVTSTFDVPLQPQAVVKAGRWVAVVFSALAVVLLVLLAGQRRGLWAGLFAGLFLWLHPDVLELARYFKEDPALLFGVALTFFALLWWARIGTWWMAFLLGAAAAVAVSAKYVGIVLLPLALYFAWRKNRLRGTALCLAGFLLVAVSLNYKMLAQLSAAKASLEKETRLVAYGVYEEKVSIPHTIMLERYADQLISPFGLLYAWGLVVWWKSRRRENGQEWEGAVETAMIFFPLAFTIMLSFSAKDAARYFHPALLGLCYTGGIGVQDLVKRCRANANQPFYQRNGIRVLTVLIIVAAIGVNAMRVSSVNQEFATDARLLMRNYIRDNLPASAVVMQGRRVNLSYFRGGQWMSDQAYPLLPQKLIDVERVCDAGSITALQEQGVTHVVLNNAEYTRYLGKEAKAKDDKKSVFEERRAFYQELFARSKVLMKNTSGQILTHNPRIVLLELPQKSKA